MKLEKINSPEKLEQWLIDKTISDDDRFEHTGLKTYTVVFPRSEKAKLNKIADIAERCDATVTTIFVNNGVGIEIQIPRIIMNFKGYDTRKKSHKKTCKKLVCPEKMF